MTAEAVLAPAALAGPVVFAVSEVSGGGVASLRAGAERACILGAALFCACCTALQVAALVVVTGVDPVMTFVVAAPPVIGAAPWACGELLSGRSRRQDESFAAALCAAYLVTAVSAAAHWTSPAAQIFGGSLFAAAGASIAYLATRGATPAR